LNRLVAVGEVIQDIAIDLKARQQRDRVNTDRQRDEDDENPVTNYEI
jgi:hypothetical protein